MATKTKKQTTYTTGDNVIVPFGLAHWHPCPADGNHPHRNSRRNITPFSVKDGTGASMVASGWLSTHAVEMELISSTDRKEAMVWRKGKIAEYRAMIDTVKGLPADFGAAVDALEKEWAVEPQLIANMGWSRSTSYPYIIAERFKNRTSDDAPVDTTLAVPCVVVRYQAEDGLTVEGVRLRAQVAENEGPGRDAKRLEPVDLFFIASNLLRQGASEGGIPNGVAGALGRGQAQKWCAIVKLASEFPAVKLADRLGMDPPTDAKKYGKGGYVNGTGLNRADAIELAKRIDGDKPATEADFEALAKQSITGKKNTPKMLGRATFESVKATATSGCLVHTLLKGILSDRKGVFDKLQKDYPAIFDVEGTKAIAAIKV